MLFFSFIDLAYMFQVCVLINLLAYLLTYFVILFFKRFYSWTVVGLLRLRSLRSGRKKLLTTNN